MPDITISELELTPEVAGTLQLASDDATGNTVKFTVSQLQNFITQATQDLLPDDTGQIKLFAFPTDNIPTAFDNYAIANGGELNRNDHAELFAKIGTVWGAGDGSTTFNKPNAFNRFTRCYSDAIGGGVYYQEQSTAKNGLAFTGTAKAPTASFAGTAKSPTASFKGNALGTHFHYEYANTAVNGDYNNPVTNSQTPSVKTTNGGEIRYVINGTSSAATLGRTSSQSAGTPSGTVTVNSYTPAGSVTVNSYTPSGVISGDEETRPVAIILVPYVQLRKFP